MAAYLTGEPAEDVIEEMPGISEAIIETHEERALPAAVITVIAGGLAFAALIARSRGREPRPALARMILVSAFLSFAAMSYVGLAGGRIHHPEVGAGGAPPIAEESEGG
jgi:hypothetical protein